MLIDPRRPDYILTEGDNARPLAIALTDVENNAVDLSQAVAVRIRIKHVASQAVGVFDCTVLDAPGGIIQYQWPVPNTMAVGEHLAQIEVELAGGTLDTYPKSKYSTLLIHVLKSLATL